MNKKYYKTIQEAYGNKDIAKGAILITNNQYLIYTKVKDSKKKESHQKIFSEMEGKIFSKKIDYTNYDDNSNVRVFDDSLYINFTSTPGRITPSQYIMLFDLLDQIIEYNKNDNDKKIIVYEFINISVSDLSKEINYLKEYMKDKISLYNNGEEEIILGTSIFNVIEKNILKNDLIKNISDISNLLKSFLGNDINKILMDNDLDYNILAKQFLQYVYNKKCDELNIIGLKLNQLNDHLDNKNSNNDNIVELTQNYIKKIAIVSSEVELLKRNFDLFYNLDEIKSKVSI